MTRPHLTLFGLAALLMTASSAARSCTGSERLAAFVNDAYGDRIAFDVLRNGSPVGEHVTRFWRDAGTLRVESSMHLEVRVLFVPVYRFDYHSVSWWCEDTLTRLAARVRDNGEESTVTARLDDEGYVIVGPAGAIRHPAPLIPTDHWNPAALRHDAALNTITGRVNRVTVDACVAAPAPPGLPAEAARCYRYRGELEAAVWYDHDGRWLGLAFDGRDGSRIVYACRNCVARPPDMRAGLGRHSR